MATAPDARDVVAEVIDLDLNLPVRGVLALPLAVCGGVDHFRGRESLQRVWVVAFDPATALCKLRMQRAFHALGIPVEPPLDVVARGGPDSILVRYVAHPCPPVLRCARPRSISALSGGAQPPDGTPDTAAFHAKRRFESLSPWYQPHGGRTSTRTEASGDGHPAQRPM